jgi:ATP-dependent 26S proteasome regulatory subunit
MMHRCAQPDFSNLARSPESPFEDVADSAPLLLFIDEIDSIGDRRTFDKRDNARLKELEKRGKE